MTGIQQQDDQANEWIKGVPSKDIQRAWLTLREDNGGETRWVVLAKRIRGRWVEYDYDQRNKAEYLAFEIEDEIYSWQRLETPSAAVHMPEPDLRLE